MLGNRKYLAYAFFTALGLAPALNGAQAACGTSLAGVWYFFDMQGSSPGITTNVKSVVKGPALSNTVNIETFTFSNHSTGYSNVTARVIKCTLTVAANGGFTAPCISYGVDGGVDSTTASGTLTVATCDLSGAINVAGDPTAVTIVGGHVNGNNGAGIAVQGPQVHHFTIVKK
jgi:hypothetical protein